MNKHSIYYFLLFVLNAGITISTVYVGNYATATFTGFVAMFILVMFALTEIENRK